MSNHTSCGDRTCGACHLCIGAAADEWIMRKYRVKLYYAADTEIEVEAECEEDALDLAKEEVENAFKSGVGFKPYYHSLEDSEIEEVF